MKLHGVPYNACGLGVIDKPHSFNVHNLLRICEVLCVQETFLVKQNLNG